MTNRIRKTSIMISGIFALIVGLVTNPALAQMEESASFEDLITQQGLLADVLTGEAVPGEFAGMDLNALTDDEWQLLCADIAEAVREHEGKAWEEAVQKVIYVSVFHPTKARLNRANLPLFYDFTLGRDEDRRIMALAALHAIGDYNTMANLAQRVRVERSLRVKRLAAAAVVDYFSPKIDVEAPTPVQN